MRRLAAPSLVVLLLSSLPAVASPWTPEDIVLQEKVGDVVVSANGSLAAWTVRGVETIDDERRATSRIWLAGLADAKAEPRALTRGRETIGHLAFSPDGRHLAFSSDREVPGAEPESVEGSQLWILPLEGGEAFPATRFDRGVVAVDWIDDESLLVARPESPDLLERSRTKAGDTGAAIDDPAEHPPVRLWKVSIAGEAERLILNDDWIRELDVAPDGTRAVVLANRSLSWEFDQILEPRAWIVDLASGERQPMDVAGSREPHSFRWTPESDAVVFVDEHSSDPRYRQATVSRLGRWEAASGRTTLSLPGPAGLAGDPHPTRNGVLVLLVDGVLDRPVRVDLDGETRPLEGPEEVGAELPFVHGLFADSVGSRLVLEISAADRPTQLYTAVLDGQRVRDLRQLTELNAGFSRKPLGEVEIVRFQGALDEEVEGLLFHPLGEPELPAPLVLAIHGGPSSRDRHAWDERWSYPNILWQQRGAFVLEVNYHGSTGYGLEWVESIRERYYELEIPDLLAGVDHVVARDLADPDRLAVVGWSNGGILGAGLITTTDRFDAAIVGAADVAWISDWANVDFGAAFDNYYFGGPPWERTEHYLEKSPYFRLPDVTTPTLVHTGDRDRAVPTHQSWMIFRTLQQVGATDVRFVQYPGEGHGLGKIGHQLRKIEEDTAWLDRYLFRPDGVEPLEIRAAVPEGSRLESKLDRAAAEQTEGVLGVDANGALVPELVALEPMGEEALAGILRVGRFEVTRAQWAAFDPSFDVPRGTGDYPVTGISFDRARQYAAWLAERTGRSLRLPTVEELEALGNALDTEGQGNVLDAWVGHAPSPADAERIRSLLAGRGVSLLLPVGSGRGAESGSGGPRVFDLDGNAAEWASDDAGNGVATGPSADRSSKPARPATVDTTGLRIVEARDS